MSYSTRYRALLPALRRYARALTGDQIAGDEAVRETLTALVSRDGALPGEGPRIELFHAFHQRWRSGDLVIASTQSAADATSPLDRLMRISPVSRQALLLTAMEGFSLPEAAAILEVEPDDVSRGILQAQREIDATLATDVLIIEDEPMIAADLQALIADLGHRECHIATTRSEATRMATSYRPSLILADVQLADGSSGIDAVREIRAIADLPVIFITAFPERLLTGERPEPAFLITKPFEPVTVKAAVGQALFFHASPSPTAPEIVGQRGANTR